MTIIIPASGHDRKWSMYHGTRKQFVTIFSEKVADRIVRLLNGVKYFITRRGYDIRNTISVYHKPRREYNTLDKLACAVEHLDYFDKSIIIYGDVYLSKDFAQILNEGRFNGITFYEKDGELYAVGIDSESNNEFVKAIEKVKEYNTKECRISVLRDLLNPNIYQIPRNDYTVDIDTPEDFRKLTNFIRRSND